MARVFVLDAMNLAYRAYYAFIRRPLVNTKGENTSAIFGFANTALKIRREERPDYWVLAWDGPGPKVRQKQFAGYKATRKPMPDDLLPQIPVIEELAWALGLPVVQEPGIEADDVMATLARRAEADGYEVVLVTSDKDLAQLVNERIKILAPGRGVGDDYTWMDAAAIEAKWGVPPERVRDVLALMGDTSDNIPGVPGIGEKTAIELIRAFGSLEALYERLGEVPRPAVRAKLEANRDMAFLSRDLLTVQTDVPVPENWDELRCGPLRRDDLLAIARRYELIKLEKSALEISAAESAACEPTSETASARAEPSAPPERGSGASASGAVPSTPPRADRDLWATPAPAATATIEARAPEPIPELAPELAPEPQPPPEEPTLFDGFEEFVPPPRELPPTSLTLAPPTSEVQGSLDLWGDAPVEDPALALEGLLDPLHEVRARALHGLAILPISVGDDPRHDTLIGLALASRDGSTCYIPIAHETGANFSIGQVREWLGLGLADLSLAKVASNLKRATHLLNGVGVRLGGVGSFDLGLGSFLCDPMRSHDLDSLARDFLGVELPPLVPPETAKRGRTRVTVATLPSSEAETAARARAAVLFPLEQAIRAQLEAREMWRLYKDLEHPLIRVLTDMERAGVAVDRGVLAELSERARVEIERLRSELFALAGEEINLESGPQVARVLFEKLQLKPGGKTAGGALSTRSDVLEELATAHPFPARLLEYRALTKLQSTYFDALPLEIESDGRIHTSFNQAGAATGRLSSYNPNLQNIPMRSEQGRAIRRAFVAPEGRVLIGADYSQIELRVMAHLSGDPNLIAAFESGEDVHVNTARRVFGIADGPLPPELRARAKIVNFGVMYGMGPRSLSQQMGISLAESQEFIRNYFRVYARMREFLDQTIEQARTRGYVQTLLGRRCPMPGLQSPRGIERSNAERAAINAPIQGSAADLMKLAMVRVHRALKRTRPSARLLLQVHDELLLEAPLEDADAVSEVVRAEMEGCFPLRVPLTVSLGRGPTWFDVH
jgi:DNA polymerase-1